MDLRLVADAAQQRGGYLTTRQVVDLGVSRRALAAALASGDIERRRRGLLVVPGAVVDGEWRERVRAAVVAAGRGAAAGGETAARLLDIAGAPAVAGITVVVPPERHPVQPPGVKIVRSELDDGDLTDVDGIAVTTPARTLLDCARRSDRVVAACLLESAARLELVTIAEMAAQIGALRPRAPGSRNARRALGCVDLRSESPLETAMRLLLLDGGLPYPQLQRPFALPEARGRIDLAYPVELLGASRGSYRGLAIEVDGREPHQRADMFHRDRVRHTALEEGDWLVRRFTDEHIHTRPGYVLAAVRRALTRVAPDLHF